MTMVNEGNGKSQLLGYTNVFFIPRVEHVFVSFFLTTIETIIFFFNLWPISIFKFIFVLLTDSLPNDSSYFGLFFSGCSEIIVFRVRRKSLNSRSQKKKKTLSPLFPRRTRLTQCSRTCAKTTTMVPKKI